MRKLLYSIAAASISMIMFPMIAFASDKTINVNIGKEYAKAEFDVTYENQGNYTATITSPNGKTYEMKNNDDGSSSVIINDVAKGAWKVDVSDNSGTSVEATSDSSSDGGETDIGKVTVTVKALKADESTVQADNIKVAKEIAGLKMYFKDDNFEIEWTDDTVGTVNVTVTNTESQKVIGSKSVSEKSYEVPVTEDVKEVTVDVVPATSADVEGAGEQYILNFNNHPDAAISFEKNEYTNKDKVEAYVTLNKEYGIRFFDNGEEVLDEVKSQKSGTYTYEIPVVEGKNEIQVYVVDENGNMRSTSDTVTKDTVAPTLQISKDINGTKTYGNTIELSGKVTDYDAITLNGKSISPDWEGNFDEKISLTDGDNHIVVSATDKAGNEAKYDVVVTKVVKQTYHFDKKTVAGIIVILVTFVLAMLRVKSVRNRKSMEEDEADDSYIEEETQDATPEKKHKKKTGFNRDFALFVFICFVMAVFLHFAVNAGPIGSGSMEPTLMTGDLCMYNCLAYINSKPQRGDIISFYDDAQKTEVTKRVIGIGGDTVDFADGYVFVNGAQLNETYLPEDTETNCLKSFTVPKDSVFVLGDNRENSYDSRYWDNPYVKVSAIDGKIMVDFGKIGISKSRAD